MFYRVIGVSICLLIGYSINSYPTNAPFLNFSFDQFIHEVVKSDDRIEFRNYYKKFMKKYEKKKMQQSWQKKFDQQLERLEQLGLSSLQIKNIQWAKKVDQMRANIVDEKERQQIKKFLVRYGSYEEFLQKKVSKYASIWTKTQSYIKNAGNSVSAWFSSWRKPKIA